MTDVPMPRLSDSMEEGTILRWLAAEGAEVQRGQELAEIETDKASMVYEADADGVLHILAGEGDTLPVGAPIAQLLGEGEAPAERERSAGSLGVDGGAAAADAPAAPPAARAARLSNESAEHGQAARHDGGRVKASPLARRLAAEAGIELSGLAGSGPGGRVVKADVEQAAGSVSAAGPSAATTTASLAAPAGPSAATAASLAAPATDREGPTRLPKGEPRLVELTRTQALIARRMAEAKATIPEFTLQRELDMDAAVRLRDQLKEIAAREQRETPSFNDMVVKACALALREHPRANATYRDGRFELHEPINVGVAVAAQDALLVPVLRDADRLSLWEIAAQSRRLAKAAREATITPPELAGGTFSVSNLGMYGVDSFTAVINPPQAVILAVGSLAPRPIVRDGQLTVGHTMSVTLSCDHRILYGADAAQFLTAVAELLERPVSLLF